MYGKLILKSNDDITNLTDGTAAWLDYRHCMIVANAFFKNL